MIRFLLALVLSATVAQAAPYATLTNFFPRNFTVVPTNPPTEIIKINLSTGGSSDLPGEIWNIVSTNLMTTNVFITNITSTTITVSNLYVDNFYATNSFVYTTNYFFTNIYAGNTYTTNLFVTNITQVDGRSFYSYVTNYYDNSIITNINTTIVNTNVLQTFSYTTNFIDNSQVIITNTYITINGTNVATMNPTDGFIPYRTGTNSFGDSPWYVGTLQRLFLTNAANTNLVFSFSPQTGTLSIKQPTVASGNTALDFTTEDGVSAWGLYRNSQVWSKVQNGHFDYTMSNGLSNYWSWTYGGTNTPIVQISTNGLYLRSNLVFGPGITNVIYRSGTDLVITNGGTSTGSGKIRLLTGDGSEADISAVGNLATLRGTSGASLQDALSSGNELRWFSNKLLPLSTNSMFGGDQSVLGSSPIGTINVKTNLTYGFMHSVSTNYNRLATYVTGTNTTDAIVFDSQASGIAGAALQMVFTNAPSYTFSGTGGQGILALSGMTKAQKAVITPTEGMIVFQTDNTPGLRVYQSGAWVMVSTVADP